MKFLNINTIKSVKAFFFYLLVIFSSTVFTSVPIDSSYIYSAKEKSEFIAKPHTVPFIEKDFIGFKEFLGVFESGSDYNKINFANLCRFYVKICKEIERTYRGKTTRV